MTVLALISDLMTQSQVSAAGQRTGTAVRILGTPEALLSAARESAPRIVVIDLSHPGLDVAELVGRVKKLFPAASIVAFGPHVHRQRLAAAEAAGCDRVLSRGSFLANSDELLKSAAP